MALVSGVPVFRTAVNARTRSEVLIFLPITLGLVAAVLIAAFRDFFDRRGFVLVDAPIFTPAACEGTSTLFETGTVPFQSIQFLLVIDASYLIASFILSDFVLDE